MREEYLARWLHEEYERLAKMLGWKTKRKCRVDFNDLPIQNKKTMLMLASSLLSKFDIKEKPKGLRKYVLGK